MRLSSCFVNYPVMMLSDLLWWKGQVGSGRQLMFPNSRPQQVPRCGTKSCWWTTLLVVCMCRSQANESITRPPADPTTGKKTNDEIRVRARSHRKDRPGRPSVKILAKTWSPTRGSPNVYSVLEALKRKSMSAEQRAACNVSKWTGMISSVAERVRMCLYRSAVYPPKKGSSPPRRPGCGR